MKAVICRLCHPKTEVKTRQGGGGANLVRKAAAWMNDLARVGAQRIVLLHDLDRDPRTNTLRDEQELLRRLAALEVPSGVDRLICIPVEELEAWFWSDDAIVKKIGGGKGRAHPNPHLIAGPKEALTKLSMGANGRARYSTQQNADLARELDLTLCAKRCPPFARLCEFVTSP